MVMSWETSVGLFPGQGGYRSGVLDTLRADPEAAAVLSVVDEIGVEMLGRSLLAVLGGPAAPDDAFTAEPELVQLAVLAASVATYETFRARGATVSVLVGHSLGEISALVAAGALSVADGARILCQRLLVLRSHDPSGGGMVALTCDRERAERVLDLLPAAGAVLAVDNGPQQVAVSGPADSLRRVERIAEAIGVPATRLRAPHPFHNQLLAAARRELATRIGPVRAGRFEVPVLSPILGRYYRGHDDLGDLLAAHLTTPVRFGPAVLRAHAGGARIWVEFGAGRTLTTLVRAAHPDVVVLTPLHGPATALDDAVAFLGGSAVPAPGSAVPVPAPGFAPTPAPTPIPTAVPIPPVVAAAPVAPADVEGAAPSRDEIAARIRGLYATALEYPEEVFEPHAELEADLGVDSVKQTELMARLGDLFELGPRPEGLRVGDYRTFGRLVDFVAESLPAPAGAR